MTDDPSSPGWTRRISAPVEHPSKDEAAYSPVNDGLALKGAQKLRMVALIAGARTVAKLPDDYARPVLEFAEAKEEPLEKT